MKFFQAPLFRLPSRTTVRFTSLRGKPYRRRVKVAGTPRQATRMFSGDSWSRKHAATDKKRMKFI